MDGEQVKRKQTGHIKRVLRAVGLVVALVCVIVLPPWNGVFAWLAPLPESVAEEVANAADRGLEGIVVYVDQAGREPVSYAAGWKERDGEVPLTAATLFKIGSISKLYVAAATAKLVGRGQLELDGTLAELLPAFAPRIANADRITLRMLLQHRSGIPNTTDQATFDWVRPAPSMEAALALVLDLPADFEPDAEHAYSNTNYLLLGMILDARLGFSHRQFIHDELVAPLGLTHTFGLLGDANLADVASAYHRPYDVDFKDVELVSPSGCMVATAEDVGVFLRALSNGTLLAPAEQAAFDGVATYGHKGWVLGTQCIARYEPEIDAVVVQCVNTTGNHTELTTLVVFDRIVELLEQAAGDESGSIR